MYTYACINCLDQFNVQIPEQATLREKKKETYRLGYVYHNTINKLATNYFAKEKEEKKKGRF